MKRISRMIIFPIKEEKSKKKTNKNKTNKRTNFKADELRPITTSEVFEVVYFRKQHFRACLSCVFLPQGNKKNRRNQALRGLERADI